MGLPELKVFSNYAY